MSARKRKAVPARLSGVPGCEPAAVNGGHHVSGNGDAARPEMGEVCGHVTYDDVMESIRSVIGSARSVEDKRSRLNAMIGQLQTIRDQLSRQQQRQQVGLYALCVSFCCHFTVRKRLKIFLRGDLAV